jgi:hypothetical protein
MPILSEEQKQSILKKKLLDEYMASKGEIDKDQATADNMQAFAGIGNALGKAATDYRNSQNSGTFLYQNPFKDRGDKPTMIGGEDIEWDDRTLNNIADKYSDSVKNKRKNAIEELSTRQKLTEWDRENANAERDDAFEGEKQKYEKGKWAHEESRRAPKDAYDDRKMAYDTGKWAHEESRRAGDDAFEDYQRGQKKREDIFDNTKRQFESDSLTPGSKVSENAKLLWQAMMLSKAKEAERAGDKEGAKAIRSMIKSSNMSSKEYYDSVKLDPDYKTLISADLANKRIEADKIKERDKGDNMPLDKKKFVDKLATEQASRYSITNQLQSSLDEFRKAKNEDDKIRYGQTLLKLLNSDQNPDAIGAEESKRIGSELEFQLFNLKNPGPMFGRDLSAFERKIQSKINAQKETYKKNQQAIDGTMGRPVEPEKPSAPTPTKRRRINSIDDL